MTTEQSFILSMMNFEHAPECKKAIMNGTPCVILNEGRQTPYGTMHRFFCPRCRSASLELPPQITHEAIGEAMQLCHTDPEAIKLVAPYLDSAVGTYGKDVSEIKKAVQNLETNHVALKDFFEREDVVMAWKLIDAGARFEIPPPDAPIVDWQWKNPDGQIYGTTGAAYTALEKGVLI